MGKKEEKLIITIISDVVAMENTRDSLCDSNTRTHTPLLVNVKATGVDHQQLAAHPVGAHTMKMNEKRDQKQSIMKTMCYLLAKNKEAQVEAHYDCDA